ncbi:MAG: endopeptidase La [Bacteroides sp.]|nr:endopeptidase La [Bacteroides sp.]
MSNNNDHIVSFGQIEIKPTDIQNDINPDAIPLLATRDFVLFPDVTFPISLGREASIAVAEKAAKTHTPIAVVCQREPSTEHPKVPDDLYEYGALAMVIKVFEIPDGPKTAILHGLKTIKVFGPGKSRHTVKAEIIEQTAPDPNDMEMDVLRNILKEKAVNVAKNTENIPAELVFNLEQLDSSSPVVNVIATHTPIKPEAKQRILSITDIKQRGMALLEELTKCEQMIQLAREIQERTSQSMNESQRMAVLQHQMDVIRQEIYGDDDDATALRKRAQKLRLPNDINTAFNREVDKLSRLNPQSPDYAVQYSYLDLLLNLPWSEQDLLNSDLNKAEEILNADHFGLDKVKERIVEQLAVMMHNPKGKSPIICLVGPPGVGKTSLGQSIARAMNRKYQRVSLGGVHDESEIRGHRRTYIGAMPGRIIDAMRRAGTINPLIVLDEIDKIASDIKGDPSAALLEVLDPEQNFHFHDNYVDLDYDLSKVLFIATANTLSTLSQPLIDRMEIIDIYGYLLEEKIEIAKRHLIPKILQTNGFSKNEIKFTDEAIEFIITHYTGESGVRQLEKMISSIVRKLVVRKLKGLRAIRTIKPSHVKEFLGIERRRPDKYEGNDIAGVVTGLAWTAVGGEILFVESSTSPAKGEKLTLTGNLGDVMKESATIALQYVKAHANEFSIPASAFEDKAIHIHVPEGAIPKDGPSAGITMATSIVSLMTGRKLRPRIAMTGEITLRGKVLAVGGIKEKILAAKRAGIDTIILSEENKPDIDDIDEIYRNGLKFIFVRTVSDVINEALI